VSVFLPTIADAEEEDEVGEEEAGPGAEVGGEEERAEEEQGVQKLQGQQGSMQKPRAQSEVSWEGLVRLSRTC